MYSPSMQCHFTLQCYLRHRCGTAAQPYMGIDRLIDGGSDISVEVTVVESQENLHSPLNQIFITEKLLECRPCLGHRGDRGGRVLRHLMKLEAFSKF